MAAKKKRTLPTKKTVLLVLFIPSVERDGSSPIDQDSWVSKALAFFGQEFGGATAFPKARGIWKDSEKGVLIYDEPVILHCYVEAIQVQDSAVLRRLGDFCRALGHETRQGEVGLVVGDEYFAFTDF